MDPDEITPWASWTDQRIIAWARAHGLNRHPRAKVELVTVDPKAPNIAAIDFMTDEVTREHSPPPSQPQKGEK